jgi:hypothetical protein
MTRGWRITAFVFAAFIFVLALTDLRATWVPFFGSVPPLVTALGWALAAFGWILLVNRVSLAFCWLRGEASCRLPRE